jgi:hypothetical protein
MQRVILALGIVSGTAALTGAPAWVEKSNADAEPLLRAIGEFSPEQASAWGLTQYDGRAADFAPGANHRQQSALQKVRGELEAELAAETDPHVRQDLEIMIHAAQLRETGLALTDRDLLPYTSVGQLIFQGEFGLLNDQSAPQRHAAALERLRRYVGLESATGTAPAPPDHSLVALAEAQFEAKLSDPALIGPFRAQVEQDLGNTERYAQGVRQLFGKAHLSGGDAALDALDHELREDAAWIRRVVLPHSRSDFRLPPELYAHGLRVVGLDIAPADLIGRAQLAYSEISNELQTLAPLVAAQHGWPETDYRAVVHRLKQEQMTPAEIEPYYQNEVIPRLEALIREHRVATLPQVPMAMRIASEAESANQPAPHMQPPVLIDNHGERGVFVLPLGNPPSKGGASEAYDDFTFKAGAWTLTAHEGRPGHELQFGRMLAGGVSHARSIFAFNSVNVEGWALYAEAEMMPYEPLDGQLIALQLRLLRAVRAISDPMLNLGQMTRERAHELLIGDVVVSEAFAREELDRFTFRTPGQATAYFYGYSRLMQLRAATQVALGPKFDRLAFNDFIVSQGLLPPDLLAEAVATEFIPANR